MIASLVAREHRRAVRGWLKRLRRTCVRRWYSYNREDFLDSLRRVGVRLGDVVIVHSSFDRFEAFDGKPTEVILALQAAVGPAGTLLMPTLPFNGTAVEYVAHAGIFDVVRTPSRMGLLTELFRRSPGVVRSVHPTHPVAAWGARSEEIIAGHHLAATPCGTGSPYARLFEYDGKILFLGTGIDAMTFFHAVEERLEPEMPFTPFTKETFLLYCKDRDGTVLSSTTRLFAPEWSRLRNLAPLSAALRQRGAWRTARIGGLEVILLGAVDVVDACRDLAKGGVYCYDH